MNIWKNKLIPFLWAFAGLMSLVPTLKQIIKGEPLAGSPLAMAFMFFTFACFWAFARLHATPTTHPPRKEHDHDPQTR